MADAVWDVLSVVCVAYALHDAVCWVWKWVELVVNRRD